MKVVTIGNATLYCGDCIEILPMIQKQIDAVVSDPPYGINYKKGKTSEGCNGLKVNGIFVHSNTKLIHGDDKPFNPSHLTILQNLRSHGKGRDLTPDVPLVLFGADHYMQALPDNGQFYAWDKACGQGPATSFIDVEFIWMNRRNPRNIYHHLWKGVLRTGEDNSNNSKRTHPSQKPVELMRWCLETARIGLNKVVCDPYMGSGSTGVACVTSGRKFIGIEIDSEYFDIACKRIEDAQRQSELALVV